WHTAPASSACTTTTASNAVSSVATTAPAAPRTLANMLFRLISKTQAHLQSTSTRSLLGDLAMFLWNDTLTFRLSPLVPELVVVERNKSPSYVCVIERSLDKPCAVNVANCATVLWARCLPT